MSLGSIVQVLLDISFTIFGFHIDIGNLGKTAKELCDWSLIEESNLGSLAEVVNATVVPISLSILGAFFLIDLIKKTMEIDRLSIERVGMTLVRFLLCREFIVRSYDLLGLIMEVGEDICTAVLDAIAYSDTTTISIGTMLGNMVDNAEGGLTIPIINWSIMPLILFIVFLIIYLPLIGTFAMAIAQIFARVVKIVVTFAFAPIPFGIAVLDDGGSSTGKRVAMSMISTCVEGLITILCVHIYSQGIANLMTQTSGDNANFGLGISCMIGILIMNSILIIAVTSISQVSERWLGA